MPSFADRVIPQPQWHYAPTSPNSIPSGVARLPLRDSKSGVNTQKPVMETILETKASSILQFIHGLRGELHVTWEEGTWAAWLYDLLQPQVHEILVCNPRRNALLKEGSKSDKVDVRKLAELLRTGMLRPVYHGEK